MLIYKISSYLSTMASNQQKLAKIALKKYSKKRERGIQYIEKLEAASGLISYSPSKSMLVIHNTDGSEQDTRNIRTHLEYSGPLKELIVASGINYGYASFYELSAAEEAYERINRPEYLLEALPKMNFLNCVYAEKSVKELNLVKGVWCEEEVPIPGISLFKDWIDETYEQELIALFDSHEWSPLTNRRVQHYGYEFIYGANNVNSTTPIRPIPELMQPILDRLEAMYGFRFDQLTVNDYAPGDSIPPHIDSHSPFEEPIPCLSIASDISMNFRHADKEYNLYLPSRGLLVMEGEGRYIWKHSISQRKYDVLNGSVHFRKRRLSITFRKTRTRPCECKYEAYCDRNLQTEIKNFTPDIEKEFVTDTYEKIAEHFSHTRYKPWPNVEKFLRNLPEYSLVLDIGCGNGKYLYGDPTFRIGTDRSHKFTQICHSRGFSAFTADCLNLPVATGSFDGVISIAVIHHLASLERRQQAVNEILRVLKIGGQGLIYVWAKEQSERNFTEQDCLVPWHLQKVFEQGEITGEVIEEKSSVLYKRFYHVFIQGELENLINSSSHENTKLEVYEGYYDRSNWCVKVKKVLK
jgi:alkylated DNA repair protein alkB family protein 8